MPFWCGVGGHMGDGKQPLPWIHIVDLCELIHFSIKQKLAGSTVFNGVAPEIQTNQQFTKVYTDDGFL